MNHSKDGAFMMIREERLIQDDYNIANVNRWKGSRGSEYFNAVVLIMTAKWIDFESIFDFISSSSKSQILASDCFGLRLGFV
jgi:hypothetical protein